MQRDSISNRVLNAIRGTTVIERAISELRRKEHNEKLQQREEIDRANVAFDAEIAKACADSSSAMQRIADLQGQIAKARNDHRDAEAARVTLEMLRNSAIDRARSRLAQLADPRIKQLCEWLDDAWLEARNAPDFERMGPAREKLRALATATRELQYQAIEDVGPVLIETRKEAEAALRSAGVKLAPPVLEDAA